MTRIRLALAAALALPLALASPTDEARAAEVADAAGYAARVEVHPFQSLTLPDASFLTGSEAGARPVTLAGVLRIPKPGAEKLPLVVLVHGSGGLGANVEFWQRALNARGVATFALDSFTGRGLTTVNTNQALLGRTNMILDVFRALGILARHPRVDPARVAVMGFSRGGQAALYASLTRFDAAWNRSGIVPAAYLPLYPDCSILFEGDTDTADRPIRIFAGGGDDYNPASFCRSYVERLQAAGRDARITVFDGAQHVFDNPVGPETPVVAQGAQTVRACAIREEPRGDLVETRSGQPFTYADPCVQTGPHIGSDASAREATLAAVTETLERAFAPR